MTRVGVYLASAAGRAERGVLQPQISVDPRVMTVLLFSAWKVNAPLPSSRGWAAGSPTDCLEPQPTVRAQDENVLVEWRVWKLLGMGRLVSVDAAVVPIRPILFDHQPR